MDAPGSSILKITSILFIIFGAVSTLFSLLAVFGSSIVTAVGGAVGVMGGVLLIGSIILIIVSVVELIVGLMGYKKSDDPSQANFFIVIGIVLCILALVSMIMSFQVTGLIGFVLPILYIVGGYMNKNAAA